MYALGTKDHERLNDMAKSFAKMAAKIWLDDYTYKYTGVIVHDHYLHCIDKCKYGKDEYCPSIPQMRG